MIRKTGPMRADLRMPRVYTPVAPLCQVDGVTLVVTAVTAYAERTHVDLVPLRDVDHDLYTAAFAEALAAWDPRFRQMPSLPRRDRFTLTLLDDARTLYVPTGVPRWPDWPARWSFTPEPPPAATVLAVVATDPDGTELDRVEFPTTA
jgi:hypothetical protein